MESSGLPPSPMDRRKSSQQPRNCYSSTFPAVCPEMDARMADWAVYSSTAAPWQHHQQHAVNTSSRVEDNPAGLQAGSLLQTDSTDWHDSFESLLSTGEWLARACHTRAVLFLPTRRVVVEGRPVFLHRKVE